MHWWIAYCINYLEKKKIQAMMDILREKNKCAWYQIFFSRAGMLFSLISSMVAFN
jgi:hypothetical protein